PLRIDVVTHDFAFHVVLHGVHDGGLQVVLDLPEDEPGPLRPHLGEDLVVTLFGHVFHWLVASAEQHASNHSTEGTGGHDAVHQVALGCLVDVDESDERCPGVVCKSYDRL